MVYVFKPNDYKRSDMFVEDLVRHQVRYLGLVNQWFWLYASLYSPAQYWTQIYRYCFFTLTYLFDYSYVA